MAQADGIEVKGFRVIAQQTIYVGGAGGDADLLQGSTKAQILSAAASTAQTAIYATPLANLLDSDISGEGENDFLVRQGGVTTNVSLSYVQSLVGSTGDVTIIGGNQVAASAYASIAALKTAVGSVKTSVLLDVDRTISSATVIPSNIEFTPTNGAKFVKSSTGTLNFEGVGISDASVSKAVFDGFGIGEVVFSGSDYPRTLSSDLWVASSLSEKLNRAIASITNKPVEILATPGTLTTKIDVTQKKTIRFSAGTYGNDVPDFPQFLMRDDTALIGAGQGLTILKESSVPGNVRMIYGSGVFNGTLDGKNYNINITDLTIIGDEDQALDSASGTIFLGNVTGFSIARVTVDATHGFGAYVGAFGTAGNYAEEGFITDCIFRRLGTQYAGIISGKNILISDNVFIASGIPSGVTVSIAVIDLEPNHPDDRMENISVINNIINAEDAQVSTVGIIAQSSDAPQMTGLRIAGNTIIGGRAESVFSGTRSLSVGIAVSGAVYPVIENNITFGGGQTGVEIDNCYGAVVHDNKIFQHGGGGNSAMGVYACVKSRIHNNILGVTYTPISQAADIREIEKTQTVNVTSGGPLVSGTAGALVYDWWKGQTVVIGGADYVVATIINNRTYTVTPNLAVTGTGLTSTTKFSSNIYKDNDASSVALAAGGASVLRSTY